MQHTVNTLGEKLLLATKTFMAPMKFNGVIKLFKECSKLTGVCFVGKTQLGEAAEQFIEQTLNEKVTYLPNVNERSKSAEQIAYTMLRRKREDKYILLGRKCNKNV